MKIADMLRQQGLGSADFTKEALMAVLQEKLKNSEYVHFIIGRHVATDLKEGDIGLCNPCNRKWLTTWLNEEGFNYEFGCNSFGVEHINIYL